MQNNETKNNTTEINTSFLNFLIPKDFRILIDGEFIESGIIPPATLAHVCRVCFYEISDGIVEVEEKLKKVDNPLKIRNCLLRLHLSHGNIGYFGVTGSSALLVVIPLYSA